MHILKQVSNIYVQALHKQLVSYVCSLSLSVIPNCIPVSSNWYIFSFRPMLVTQLTQIVLVGISADSVFNDSLFLAGRGNQRSIVDDSSDIIRLQ